MVGRTRRNLIALGLAFGLSGTAFAYKLDGGRWDGATAKFHINIPGTAQSGLTWNSAFEAALDTWTSATDFNFQIERTYIDPCKGYSRSLSLGQTFPAGDGDRLNGTDFRANVCGNDFGTGVLAITLNYSEGGSLGFHNIVESDIIFNSAFSWNVYSGARTSRNDFGRVALHELGHTIGLDHELVNEAIMQPRITDLDHLMADDIAGVNALYGESSSCKIQTLGLHAVVTGALEVGDCRIQDLFNTGSDTSFTDIYRIKLEQPSKLHISVSSAVMDPVLLIFTPQLKWLADFDDEAGCNVAANPTLEAGEYLLLVNTYTEPKKCGTNTGPYSLSITDSELPLTGPARNTSGSKALAAALFSGGASADGGLSYSNRFTASQAIDVDGRIGIDPLHQGLPGKIYVLVTLTDGRLVMKTSANKFLPFSGNLATLQPYRSGTLKAVEEISVIQGLRGELTGLAGLGFVVHLGYSEDSQPANIHYGSGPIRFSIDP